MEQRGRRKTRTGAETRSTFDKPREVEIAVLLLQQHYLTTGRSKPSMRDLLIEGVAALLEREGLPAMPKAPPESVASVIEMPKKTGA